MLFEDTLEVRQLNVDGKKFERVNRLHCKSNDYDVDIVLDVNAELFPARSGDTLKFLLASTLSLNGTPDDGSYNQQTGPSLADAYDYVMHGRIFKIAHKEGQTIEILSSFGGLLMKVEGDQAQLSSLKPDMALYLLMKSM